MAVSMDMEGNVQINDSDIPKGKKKIKFRFTNLAEEPICDLTITTHSDAWYFPILNIPFWDAPDILKVSVYNEGDPANNVPPEEVGSADFTKETEPGTTSADLKFSPCIGKDEEFEIKIEFDMPFEPGDWLELSPSGADGYAIAMANYDADTTGSPEFAGFIPPLDETVAAHSLLAFAALVDTAAPFPERLRPMGRRAKEVG